ncbi:phage tail protein, P2 protein I family [Sphingomonas laterariae]|uniref:Phage tail protein, P2 protein I family n=1 Tax=Edaphosphingomonas laterariae TaxID=861865 RepID=A0A239CJC5_9SPHN|nr:phage tail protein I [Sphingomonas laterariae]SNS20336.1 phage tail protein, P2 protein I family [Sphingomonas laterariae]
MSLLPPNATMLERAIEQAIARIGDVPTPLRTLKNPSTSAIDLLPWLVWELSLDAWSSDWPESIKRARARQAIPIARRKGTVESVRTVVASFGGSVALREWWETAPRGTPHTFELVLNLDRDDAPASAAFVDQVIAEVIRAKPVRSHFTFTQGLTATARIGLVGAIRPAVYARLSFAAAAYVPPPGLSLEGVAQGAGDAAGDIAIAADLTGEARGQGQAQAAPALAIHLGGEAAAQGQAQGDLRAGSAMEGAAQGTSEATGDIAMTLPIAADAVATGEAAGDLATALPIAAEAEGAGQASGDVAIVMLLASLRLEDGGRLLLEDGGALLMEAE